jgi:hypothetical protein
MCDLHECIALRSNDSTISNVYKEIDRCIVRHKVAIESRVARKYYGNIMSTKFDSLVHDESRKRVVQLLP